MAPTAEALRARAGRSALTVNTLSECDETLARWRTATATTNELALPPLRERGADIAALVQHMATGAGLQLTQNARDALRRDTWPGDVAELEHVVVALAAGTPKSGVTTVAMADLPAHVLTPQRHLTEMEKAETRRRARRAERHWREQEARCEPARCQPNNPVPQAADLRYRLTGS